MVAHCLETKNHSTLSETIMNNTNSLRLIACLALSSTLNIHAQTVFLGGDLADAARWTDGLPGDNQATATINVDGTLFSGAQNNGRFAGATITIDGGATFTTIGDSVDPSTRDATYIVNDATFIADDDIFTDRGTLIFGAASVTQVDDDFQSQNTGTLTINGGTHTVGDNFGIQSSGGVLNFLGGTVNADTLVIAAAAFIGGDATATTRNTDFGTGSAEISNAWSGSITITQFSGSDWETSIVDSWTLEGATITSESFIENFIVTNGGQTLELASVVIPEPSTYALAAGVLALTAIFIRRKRG